MDSKPKLSRPSIKPAKMSPAKANKDTSTSPKGMASQKSDTFNDLDENEYRHITAGKRSVFSQILADSALGKTAEDCKTCWDRLRTRNFQIAGAWYLQSRSSSEGPFGTSSVTVTAIRAELGKDSEYLVTPLEECLQLSTVEAAARYIWFIVKEEGQDPDSFIHDLGGVRERVTFVIDRFRNCKFGSATHKHALTQMLFPLTRKGDWRRKHLSSKRGKKRSFENVSKEHRSQDVSDHEGDLAILDPVSKRSKTRSERQDSESESAQHSRSRSFTPRRPPGQSIVKSEDETHLQNIGISSRQAPVTEPAISISGATGVVDSGSFFQRDTWDEPLTPHDADPLIGLAQELRAPTMSPISPQVNHRAVDAEGKSIGAKATAAVSNLTTYYPPDGTSSTSPIPGDLRDLRQDGDRSLSTDVTLASSLTDTISGAVEPVGASRMLRRISELEEEAQDREATVTQLRQRMSEQDAEIQKGEEKIKALKTVRKEDNDLLANKERVIADLKETTVQMKTQAERLLSAKDEQTAKLSEDVARNHQILLARTQQITQLQEVLVTKNGRITDLEKAQAGAEVEIKAKDHEIRGKKESLEAKHRTIGLKNQLIARLRETQSEILDRLQVSLDDTKDSSKESPSA